MAKFKMTQNIDSAARVTTRLGVGSVNTTPANAYTDKEIGKFVKLSGTDAHVLCAVGDPIQGFITSVESYTTDDFSIGTISQNGRKRVLLDGSQAAGTGSIAIGDYVVCGTPVAKDTALTLTTPPKVRKATKLVRDRRPRPRSARRAEGAVHPAPVRHGAAAGLSGPLSPRRARRASG